MASFVAVGRKERPSIEAALVPLTILLCLEKSWGLSRGPSGTLFRPPRSAGGGGREAFMAFEALVLRRRLPFSVVFWNLRTRSSDEPLESSAERVEPDLTGGAVDAVDSSMARGAVRGWVVVAMGQHRNLPLRCNNRNRNRTDAGEQAGRTSSAASRALVGFCTPSGVLGVVRAETDSKRRAWAPVRTMLTCRPGPRRR